MISGFLTGLLGVGGGFVIVPSLTANTDLGMRSIVATSLAVIALVSISGVTAAAMRGGVDWSVAAPFAGGAAVALAGLRPFADRIRAARLQQAFAALCVVVAMLLFARGFGFIAASRG